MRKMFGRKTIYTNATEINAENVVDEIAKAVSVHNKNKQDINYLLKYYTGDQPVINRKKEIRPEIRNVVVENRANEIVAFKTGYLAGEPIQYVSHSSDKKKIEDVSSLNMLMDAVGKATLDKNLVEWFYICGTAYRLVLPVQEGSEDPENNVFRIYTLDPREAFVIYSSGFEKKPLAGCYVAKDENNQDIVTVYTENKIFYVQKNNITKNEDNYIGMIPIIEYPANSTRIGAFEVVLPVLDAINELESNRLDSVQQTVQAFMKFVNCDITLEQFEEFKKKGAIKVHSGEGLNADVDLVSKELNQTQTQVLVDHLYQSMLTICGMPNRNGGSSTSDTGAGVILRDGWQSAEARAKDSEMMFRKSEKDMLRVVLTICKAFMVKDGESAIDLSTLDIDIKFTRRNYEHIEVKAQVLCEMLNNDKIHPKMAYESCGLFTDTENAYKMGVEHYETVKKELGRVLDDEIAANKDEGHSSHGGEDGKETGETV